MEAPDAQAIVESLGGETRVAAAISAASKGRKLTRQAVHQWRLVPWQYCGVLAGLPKADGSHYTVAELRPEIAAIFGAAAPDLPRDS